MDFNHLLLPFFYYCIELTLSLTHFYVFIGFKNPALSHIRREKYYFLGDAICHMINIVIFYKTKGLLISIYWLFLFVVHIFYFIHLWQHDKPSVEHNLYPIFKWSCIGYNKKRFDFKESGSEIVQTIMDIVGHLLGGIFIMEGESWVIQGAGAVLVFASSLIFYRFYKYFVTDEKMMPKVVADLFKKEKMKIFK